MGHTDTAAQHLSLVAKGLADTRRLQEALLALPTEQQKPQPTEARAHHPPRLANKDSIQPQIKPELASAFKLFCHHHQASISADLYCLLPPHPYCIMQGTEARQILHINKPCFLGVGPSYLPFWPGWSAVCTEHHIDAVGKAPAGCIMQGRAANAVLQHKMRNRHSCCL